MKRSKQKPKPKRKAKGKVKERPAKAAKQVLTSGERQRDVSVVETQGEIEDTRNVEIPVQIPDPTSSEDIREAAEDAASPVEVRGEIEVLARSETPVEKEGSADLPGIREAAEDTASAAEVQSEQSEVEDLASIIEIEVEIENSARPANIRDPHGSPSGAPGIYDGSEIPTIPVGIPITAVKRAPHSAASSGADRRAHPRYAFRAAVEVVAADQGAQIKSQVRDLSQQGCYVDTASPLALGTATDVAIVKGVTTFEARARVVYNQTGKGMGLMFIGMEPDHRKTLDTWIAESRESSWRAANRRRSQRALMTVPVGISGQAANGTSFEERTHTLSISAHGALIVLAAAVQRGQRFILSNLQTKAALECVVVYLERTPGGPTQVGVEFMLPNQTFWRVAFPPEDWTPRHPDAKSR